MRPPARPLWRAHDGAAYLGERRAVGEAHGGAFGLDTELLPQLHELGRDGAVFHLRVEILERRGADRLIAGPQDALDRPVRADPAALARRGAQRLLSPAAVPPLRAARAVSQPPDHRAAPVRARPGGR